MHYEKLEEVCERLGVDREMLRLLVREGLIEVKRTIDEEEVVSVEDAERMRVSLVLLRDLDVNMAGVEVVLHMREELLSVQRQFDEILHALVDELRQRLR